MWTYRERLSRQERLRRSYYEMLRDALEVRLIKISLIDSFYRYIGQGVDYAFLDKSELKPKSKKMEKESELFNTFIVIFCEGSINPSLRNYIRFFPENKVIKQNLEYLANISIYDQFHKNLRYFDNPRFLDFTEEFLNIDYALLIQQDPAIKKKNKYALTHFHVKIDWPIADAAQDLAKSFKYIHNHLYENGEKEARLLQNKLFEYYGCYHNVGGRRTAALIAAQLLRKEDFVSTVYVSSSESRSMMKYTERGVSKFFLIQLNDTQIDALAQREGFNVENFKSSYLYPADSYYVGISEAVYGFTPFSKPPEDGKFRRLKPAYNWLKLKDEFLLPRDTAFTYSPINYNWVYSPE